jgi:hypothetical protein
MRGSFFSMFLLGGGVLCSLSLAEHATCSKLSFKSSDTTYSKTFPGGTVINVTQAAPNAYGVNINDAVTLNGLTFQQTKNVLHANYQ